MKNNKLIFLLIVALSISVLFNLYQVIEKHRQGKGTTIEECNLCPDGKHYYKNDVSECFGSVIELSGCPEGIQIGDSCYQAYINDTTVVHKCPDGQYEYEGNCYSYQENTEIFVHRKDTLFIVTPNGDTVFNPKFSLKKVNK